MVSDGKLASKDAMVTINIPKKVNVCHKGRNTLNISRNAVAAHLGHGDNIGICAQ